MIDTGEPSPASLRSAPLAHRGCATRQAHARVRREGTVRERGYNAFHSKPLSRTAGEGGPSRRAWWVRVCGGPATVSFLRSGPGPMRHIGCDACPPNESQAAALSDLDAMRRGAGFPPN
jgi:hypothetical protein